MGFSILKQVSDEPYEISDINVTPFIDVMLVLLIIFMVAAPLSTSNIKIDLPTGTDKTQKLLTPPLVVTIKKDGTLYVNNQPVDQAGLSAAIKRAIKPGDDDRIFLQADKGLQYQQLITIMDTLRHEGYTKIALVDLTGN